MPVTVPSPASSDDLRADLDALLFGPEGGLPSPERSAALRARVLDAVSAEPDRPEDVGVRAAPTVEAATRAPVGPSTHHGRRWLAVAAVGAVLATGAAVVPGTVAEAHAGQVLSSAAERIAPGSGPVLGPGQFLHVETTSRYTEQAGREADDGFILGTSSSVFLPADAGVDAVEVAGRMSLSDGTSLPPQPPEARPYAEEERNRTAGLAGVADLGELPRDPDALLAHFRSRYAGGSASRDEDLFVQLTDVLRDPLLPVDLRAALLDALARAPGVRAEDRVPLSDGRVGIGLRRAEPLRHGLTAQLVVDFATGQVIGERELFGTAVGEFRTDDVIAETLRTVTVVDTVPVPRSRLSD